ncbi:MAG: hypothetical protein H6668_21160 [Ardenticatenaceae bacterium]|nr:hypothetical protein [Ardenticatenaceae bacterium]
MKSRTSLGTLLVVMLAIALVITSCNSADLEGVRGTLAAIEPEVAAAQAAAAHAATRAADADLTADNALTQAQTAVNTAAEASNAVSIAETAVAQANAAQETAHEALAVIETAVAAEPEPEETPIPLFAGTGGIALTFIQGGEETMIMYPVEDVRVYRRYSTFASEWASKPNIIVQLAWTADKGDQAWQLDYVDRMVISGNPNVYLSETMLTSWHEYLAYTQVGSSSDANLDVVEYSLRQTINDTTMLAPDQTITNLGQNHPTSGRKYVQFLLTDTSSGQHTLVTVLEHLFPATLDATPTPKPPDDLDSAGQQQCLVCAWGACQLGCWWYGSQ